MRSLLISSTEMVLAVALVLLFALIFIGILVVSFPKGTGLADFYTELVEGGTRDSRLQWGDTADEDGDFVAVLTRTQRRVRDRSASAITWSDAHAGMQLEDHHTVQTLGGSSAAITVGDAGELRLGERSLVVVKRENRRRGLGRKRSSVALLRGAVEGSITPGEGKTGRLGIATPGGRSELRSRGAEGTEFTVAVNPDESSTIAVHSGVAEIKTADGTLKVGPDESITYDTTGFLGRAEPIPDPPAPQSPRDGDDLVFGAVPPRILFRWGGGTAADAYRLVLARDRELDDVVFDREMIGTEFVHGNLQSGRYYWCVKTVTGYVESRCSTVRGFRLIQDLEPPELRVDLPQGAVAAAEMIVRGAAEPGSEVFIKNEQVTLAASGEFEYVLKLNPGLNMIVVEAVDAAGNSAYRSQYVTAAF